MSWTAMHIVDTLVFAGYVIWFALLAWHRLRSPGIKLLPLTDRLRGLGLGVLLLPLVAAEAALRGTFGQLVAVAAPGVALAFWTFAPRYVTSKVVPLAIVADGLYGFYRVRLYLHYYYLWPRSTSFTFYPQFLLLEAWLLLAVGLWLTCRSTDQNSAAARAILREGSRLPDDRGRPRWGLLLLVVVGLVAELFGRNFWLGTSWSGGVETMAAGAAVVFFVVKAPRTTAHLAWTGLILFGLYGALLAVYWPGRIPLLSPHDGLDGYGMIYLADSAKAIGAGIEGLILTGFGLWLGLHLRVSRTRTAIPAEQFPRLEPVLPDGTRANLIAIEMVLRTAERLMATSPQAALELVSEARNLEVPCASSSPKISSFSGTA